MFFKKKSLGQHFLIHQPTCEKITQSYSSVAENILEIGPGAGALTKYLYLLKKPLYLIEKDLRLIEDLKKFVPKKIYPLDYFAVPMQEFSSLTHLWLVSNLPYNVGTRIFIDLAQYDFVRYLTLMFQKEVGLRFIDTKMNFLKSFSLNYFHIKKLLTVSKNSFDPPPQVDSMVVLFERKKPIVNNYKSWLSFNKELFAFPRKQLKSRYPQEIVQLKRAEELDFETILYLYEKTKFLKKKDL